MSWNTRGLAHVRVEFVILATQPEVNVSQLCSEFGISRKTGYKWLSRYRESGFRGLDDRSCRPLCKPLATSAEMVAMVVKLRHLHPYWGPKKLRAMLEIDCHGHMAVPSVATVGRILKQCGLSENKGRGRPRRWEPASAIVPAGRSNEVWTVDFKGWWRTGDGKHCEPLTVRDLFSRYILCLRPLQKRDTKEVRKVFEEIFARYGLPERIRSDNGSPFASITGLEGLTRLSAWWLSLGVEVDRTQPGHPEQNGAHERMHADIAREIQGSPAATLEEEVRRLEYWRQEYNTRRPHEALGNKRPADLYSVSHKTLKAIRPYRYPAGFETRKVGNKGCFKLDGALVFLSEALSHQEIGMEPLGNDSWRIWFCNHILGVLPPVEAGQGDRPRKLV